ncbi:MAG: DUF4387 domain-containing protein [Chloroflexota bacterium]|nr:DUF4387 domain-containing protein [Chloroflexota bacterium]
MPKLWQLAKLVRAKNAGPFTLTFDIVFADVETYEQVKRSGAISRELFARLYRVPVEEVLFFEHDRALALKASIPRPIVSGDVGDTDVFGGQQHGPLVDLEIPIAADRGG